MKRRVVVTGIGCLTPIGNDVASMWKAQQAGSNGVGSITHFDASHFPTKFAAEVRGFDFSSVVMIPRFDSPQEIGLPAVAATGRERSGTLDTLISHWCLSWR